MIRKKIAVILSRFPFPLDKGDKLRAFHQIKYLSQFHDIYLFCLHTETVSADDKEHLRSYCADIVLFKISIFDIFKGILFSLLHHYPVQVGYFFSRNIKKKLRQQILEQQIDTIYCQLSRTALYAHDLPVLKVVDFQDAFSTNYKRLIENTKGIYKLFYRREYRTMLAFEQNMLQWFNTCTIISTFDKLQIEGDNAQLHVVPNGVDTQYFTSQAGAKKYDIVFVGNLSYLPNKNAVYYLIHEIFPILKRKHPQIKINIAGADTPKELYELANENITVSGFAPDIRDVYRQAKILVAPLFTGAGLQNKLLEAMSMQLPCVTTSVVNSSLNAEDNRHVLLANTPEEFAFQIISLLSSEEKQQQVSRNARLFVEDHYTWEAANQLLLALL